jgi:nucleoside-diphosphate-sugar epimerase
MSEERTVLLVGATGAVGGPTVRALRAAGVEVRALVRTEDRSRVAAGAGATPVVGDLFEPATVVPHLEGVDAVVNLATRIPAPARAVLPGAWAENDRIRMQGSTALVDAAVVAGVPTVVQESIVFQYADGGDAWIDEDAAVDRTSVTASTETAEANVARFVEHGGTGVVLRFGLFYGPHSTHTDATLALVRRGFSPLLGAPTAYQSAIHLDDAASAVVAALGVPSGTYNVADDEPLTRAGFGRALAAALEVKEPRLAPGWAVRLMGKKVEPITRSQRVSNARFKAATDWVPIQPSVRAGWRAVVAAEREAVSSDG